MSEQPGNGPVPAARDGDMSGSELGGSEMGEIDMVAYRARQRARANAMAIALTCLAVLFFLVTIAKMEIFG